MNENNKLVLVTFLILLLVLVTFLILLIGTGIILLIVNEAIELKLERECYKDIAEGFCERENLTYLGINGANSFFVCGDERTLIEDGDNYRFSNKEKDKCYHYSMEEGK